MSKWKNTLKIFLIFLCSSAIASAIYNSTHKVPSFLYFNKFIDLFFGGFILHLLLLFLVKSIQFLFILIRRIFSKTAISTKASSNFLLSSAITLSILFNYFLYEGGKRQMQTEKYLEIEKREEIERRLKKSTKEQNKVSDQEELKRKMTEYYKGASGQEIDELFTFK